MPTVLRRVSKRWLRFLDEFDTGSDAQLDSPSFRRWYWVLLASGQRAKKHSVGFRFTIAGRNGKTVFSECPCPAF